MHALLCYGWTDLIRNGQKSMTQSKLPLLLFGFALTFLFGASEIADADTVEIQANPLTCAYSHTLNLGFHPDITPPKPR